jgi:hypothetical protein
VSAAIKTSERVDRDEWLAATERELAVMRAWVNDFERRLDALQKNVAGCKESEHANGT